MLGSGDSGSGIEGSGLDGSGSEGSGVSDPEGSGYYGNVPDALTLINTNANITTYPYSDYVEDKKTGGL